MARVITSYKAYGIYIDEPVTTRAHQVLILNVTQAAGDVAMDLANTAGTFWTEADNDATGLAAKGVLAQIIAKAEARVSWCAPAVQDAFIQVAGAPAGATEYQITTTSIVPSLAFFAASAPTAVQLVLVVVLSKEQRAVRAGSL